MKEAVEELLESRPPQGLMDLPVTATVDARRYDDTLWTPLTHAASLPQDG